MRTMNNKTGNSKISATRRTFIKSAGATATGLLMTSPAVSMAAAGNDQETLALDGGPKAVTASSSDATTWPRYGAEEEMAVVDVLRKPNYSAIDALEADWKKHFNLPYCKAHYNGTSAITAMFFALNLPAGSEIMVPCSTFWATITPMRFFGLVPIMIDINPVTLNFDIEDAKRKLTKNTRAVFPVHYLGMPADMDRISDFCKEKGLIVLEDACHAHGASMHGKFMGAWGRMACFSFQASKPLPAIEGGMGNYQDQEDFEKATILGHYEWASKLKGSNKKYSYGMGMKLRMHPMAAALARCQLEKLDKYKVVLKAQVRKLNDRIARLPGLYEQQNRPDVDRVYYAANRFLLNETEAGMSRNVCVKALKAEGVSAGAAGAQFLCDNPIFHEAEWWHHMPVIADKFPGALEVNKRGISLPFFTKEMPELTEQYIKAFEKVWAHRKQLGKS
ncbi:MAG: DegT/DnrJ/EryC1/StrS family aminotransferase [Kiritimatiellae bacterium]|nr:DegT/DnrJ/EryC1/StrS family aminotransferase [Kiritimatiellia bacterium]MDD5522932.1 DegT/DnrJ/EryC1/StrS family aminotransferase [Kiritimatiellia bacterium]